jgi:hypothetical protein
MTLRDQFALPLLLRSVTKIGKSIDARLAEQNRLLARIADHLAPAFHVEPLDQAVRSVDFSEDQVQGKVLALIDRFVREIGREPTEDEIIAHLDGQPV